MQTIPPGPICKGVSRCRRPRRDFFNLHVTMGKLGHGDLMHMFTHYKGNGYRIRKAGPAAFDIDYAGILVLDGERLACPQGVGAHMRAHRYPALQVVVAGWRTEQAGAAVIHATPGPCPARGAGPVSVRSRVAGPAPGHGLAPRHPPLPAAAARTPGGQGPGARRPGARRRMGGRRLPPVCGTRPAGRLGRPARVQLAGCLGSLAKAGTATH